MEDGSFIKLSFTTLQEATSHPQSIIDADFFVFNPLRNHTVETFCFGRGGAFLH